MVTVSVEVPGGNELVVMTNVAVIPCAGTTTLAGKCVAFESEVERVTVAPPAGAAEDNVTVPVD